MSKVTTLKNQNKLRVYLEKVKNDIKPISKADKSDSNRPRTN